MKAKLGMLFDHMQEGRAEPRAQLGDSALPHQQHPALCRKRPHIVVKAVAVHDLLSRRWLPPHAAPLASGGAGAARHRAGASAAGGAGGGGRGAARRPVSQRDQLLPDRGSWRLSCQERQHGGVRLEQRGARAVGGGYQTRRGTAHRLDTRPGTRESRWHSAWPRPEVQSQMRHSRARPDTIAAPINPSSAIAGFPTSAAPCRRLRHLPQPHHMAALSPAALRQQTAAAHVQCVAPVAMRHPGQPAGRPAAAAPAAAAGAPLAATLAACPP